MDIFSLQFLYALGAIVLIDLVLAGDNAIVIALAARKLPPQLQTRAILWGTVGAIVVRTLMTVAVVWLLQIPGLLLLGGALLLWIAVKLLAPHEPAGTGEHGATSNFWGAMKTIVVADAVMGLDNVLAVAGAAQGSFLLVVLGLLISIPIVVWGSTLILKWVERYPAIVYAGAAVLVWTAAKMMLAEPLIKTWIAPVQDVAWLAQAGLIAAVLAIGWQLNLRRKPAPLRTLQTLPAPSAVSVQTSIPGFGKPVAAPFTTPVAALVAAPVAASIATPIATPLAAPAAASAPAVSLKETAAMTLAPVMSVMSEAVVNVNAMFGANQPSGRARTRTQAHTTSITGPVATVLLPVNDSKASLAAVSKFIASTPHGAPVEVHLAHVVPALHRHITRHLPAPAVARFGAARAAALTPALRMLEVAGFKTETHVLHGRDTVEAILGLARRIGVHRIVIGSVPKSGLVRFLTHSVTGRLLERAPVPVEVVLSGVSPWYVRFGLPAGLGVLIAALAFD